MYAEAPPSVIPVDKLMAVNHIVTHINCADGLASAMILKTVLPDAKITFAQYDSAEHIELEPAEGVLFADFSPYKASTRVNDWIEAGTIVLDHHKTQKELVERFPLGIYNDAKGVSGAVLAYEHVWKPLAFEKMAILPNYDERKAIIERFAMLTGVRDTWFKESQFWVEANQQAQALHFWDKQMLDVPPEEWAEYLKLGPVLYAKRLADAKDIGDKAFRYVTARGTRVAMVQTLSKTSDVAELLGDQVDLLVGFGYGTNEFKEGGRQARVTFSMRSHTGYDCGSFAKAHGGGGHPPAAGFTYKAFSPWHSMNPYGLFFNLIHTYEDVVRPTEEGEEAFEGTLTEALDAAREREYHTTFNRYQRDNLVWLLAACGYPAQEVEGCIEPFTMANTGDWLGEVAIMLDYDKGVGSPNMSLEDLRKHVDDWRTTHGPQTSWARLNED